MKAIAKRVIKSALGKMGLELLTTEKYRGCVSQLHDCLIEFAFPHLPDTPGRVELLTQLLGTEVSEAMFILEQLHLSLSVPGDVCEFGVAQGATSALLANEIRTRPAKLWLFDSFQGLPEPTRKDVLINDIFSLGSMDRYQGKMAFPVMEVKRRLREIEFPLERFEIVAGFVELNRKPERLPDKVSFAYVDFDLYEPVVAALEILHPLLSVHSRIVVDDYGFFSAGARTAVTEFLESHGRTYKLELPPTFAGHFCMLEKIG